MKRMKCSCGSDMLLQFFGEDVLYLCSNYKCTQKHLKKINELDEPELLEAIELCVDSIQHYFELVRLEGYAESDFGFRHMQAESIRLKKLLERLEEVRG